MRLLCTALALVTLSGCVGVRQTDWVRIDGSLCRTTRVKVAPYAGETETDCLVNGKAQQISTNHDDLSMLGGIAALMSAIVATQW